MTAQATVTLGGPNNVVPIGQAPTAATLGLAKLTGQLSNQQAGMLPLQQQPGVSSINVGVNNVRYWLLGYPTLTSKMCVILRLMLRFRLRPRLRYFYKVTKFKCKRIFGLQDTPSTSSTPILFLIF